MRNSVWRLVLVLSVAAGTLAASGLYQVTDLGTLGGAASYATGINSSGQVSGVSQISGGTLEHAFLYSGGVMQDLGTLGGTQSQAWAIDASGEVVGGSYLANTDYHAFVDSGGVMQDLGLLGESEALGVNGAGQVVGDMCTGACDAFLYSGGVTSDLGNLGGSASAIGVNDLGQVVGQSYLPGYTAYHAFLYSGGVMQDLGTLGGTNSVARGINDSGQIVGWSDLPGDTVVHAFLYSGGVMYDLGAPAGSSSYAYAINSSGAVVGYMTPPLGFGNLEAFLYSGGVMQDLDNLVPPGWGVYQAWSINDRGQIVGYGHGGHAVLLTPENAGVPEPSGLVLLASGLVGLLAVRRRRGDPIGRREPGVGGRGGIRTPDPGVANAVLSQLSYTPTLGKF